MNINTLKKHGFHYCSRNLHKKYLLKNKSLMIRRINIQGLSVGEFYTLLKLFGKILDTRGMFPSLSY